MSMSKRISSNSGRIYKARTVALVCLAIIVVSGCAGLPSTPAIPTPTSAVYLGTVAVSTAAPSTAVPQATLTPTDDPNDPNKQDLLSICGLVDQADAEAVLGQPTQSITPFVHTDTTGDTVYSCTYLANEIAVVISLDDMGVPQDAQDSFKATMAKAQADSTVRVVEEKPVLGNLSYWFTSETACGFFGTKNQYFYSVILGGKIGDAESHKAALLILENILTSKL
jgi:hypothetical protein